MKAYFEVYLNIDLFKIGKINLVLFVRAKFIISVVHLLYNLGISADQFVKPAAPYLPCLLVNIKDNNCKHSIRSSKHKWQSNDSKRFL